MSMRHLIQAIRWISKIIWSYFARPFRRTSMQMELPTASPIPPSTPSFIQRDEPDIALDAMRIFRLDCGPPRASRIARNKSAITEMRVAPPNSNRIASLCSTDPSPGFSLLNDVVDNIVLDCSSVYSSPPSSPSSSLHTPCIVVSSTMGEIVPDKGPSGSFLRQGPRIVESDDKVDDVSRGEVTSLRPDIINSAKRRDFKGPPILTNLSRDTLLIPKSRPSHASNASRESFFALSGTGRPRSAFATVTEYMRASATHMSPRSASSREAFMTSPESQAAFTENSPFSVYAESFFVDDHIPCPSVVDIYDIGIYADPQSLLNLQPPKRQRNLTERGRHKRPPSSHTALNSFGKPVPVEDLSVRGSRLRSFAEDPISDDLSVRPRSLTDADTSSADITYMPNSPALVQPSPVLSVENSCLDGGSSDDPAQSASSDTEDRQSVSARLALYASLIFPFGLEDSICLDDVTHILHQVNDSDDLDVRKGLDLSASTPPDPVEDIAKLFEIDASDLFPTVQEMLPLPSVGLAVPLPTVSDAAPFGESLSQGPGCFPPALACSVPDFTEGISPRGLCASEASVPVSILHGATDKFLEAMSESNRAVSRENEDCSEGPLSHVILPSRVPCSAINRHHYSRQSLDRTDDDSRTLPISCESGVQPNASQMAWPIDSCEVVHTSVRDDLHGQGNKADGPQSELTIVNRRRERRIGIYGELPSSWGAPQDKNEPSDLRNTERRKFATMYPTRRGSKPGSPLRPLVLPMCLAVRGLDDSRGTPPSRSSIGRPPPFPLPDVPLRKSSSASAVTSFGSSRLQDQFQKLQGALSGPEELRHFSSPAPILSPADDENSSSNPSVNWGIAF